MADTIKATPRNKLMGLLADALGGAYDYAQRPDPTMPMGKANAVLGLLSDALPLKSAATVLDDLSYGQAPIRGIGMTTRLTPEATELAINALPFPRTAGKVALMGAGVVPGMEAAMFIGPTAKTWDKAAAATAQKLEKAGADPKAIWRETVNLKGLDGMWRQEIDDSAANLIENKTARDFMAGPGPAEYPLGPIGGFLEHPLMNKAYPDAMQIKARLVKGNGGSYIPNTGFGEGFNLPSIGTKSTTLHELQHAIQQREGFAKGGSPSEFAGQNTDRALKELIAQQTQGLDPFSSQAQSIRDKLFDSLAKDDAIGYPQKLYRRLAGEAEARATQARMNMTPAERRATFPYDSYDVPVNELIVRGLLAP